MSNGVEAMRAQRERRGKPTPMHPRQGGSANEQQQAETATQDDASAAPVTAPASEQSAQTAPARQGSAQRQPTRPVGTKGDADKSSKATSKAKQASAATTDDGGAVGKAQGKQVSDVALSWAAAARKQAERAELVRGSVEVARHAGTPEHVLLSALRAAEYRAGVPLPDEVWHAAGLRAHSG